MAVGKKRISAPRREVRRAPLGVPLVPADESADGALGGLRGFEAEVAGGEVELFVVERVVGDVHLAVGVGDGAVFFDGDGRCCGRGPGARRSKRDATRTTPVSRQTRVRVSVEGPGMGSARPKRAWSSRWQKYWARKSSGRQTSWAPWREAS